ncbi:MAG: nicotinamide riboside transporter PnuC [Clostridia bacterium]
MIAFIKRFSTFEKVYFTLCIIAMVVCLILHSSVISVIMVTLSLTAGLLNSKRIKIALLIFSITSIIYAYISYSNGFIGEAIINVFYNMPIYLISFIRSDKKRNSVMVEINHVNKKYWFWIVPIAIIFTIGYGYLLQLISGITIGGITIAKVSLPFSNAFSTCILIIAVFLTSQRYLEQWYIWLISNVVLLAMWIIAIVNGGSNDYALVVQNLSFIGINLNGLLQWRKVDKILKKDTIKGEEKT